MKTGLGVSATPAVRKGERPSFSGRKYIGQRELTILGITFCQIPYEMHRPVIESP